MGCPFISHIAFNNLTTKMQPNRFFKYFLGGFHDSGELQLGGDITETDFETTGPFFTMPKKTKYEFYMKVFLFLTFKFDPFLQLWFGFLFQTDFCTLFSSLCY